MSRPNSADQIEGHRLAGEFSAPTLFVDSTHTSLDLSLTAEPVPELAELCVRGLAAEVINKCHLGRIYAEPGTLHTEVQIEASSPAIATE